MIKHASHLASRLALAGSIALGMLAVLLGLRLYQGPISLSVLTPFIEAAMEEGLPDYHARIEDTVLRWSRDEGRVDLRFVNVTLSDSAGRAVVAVPEMEVGFSAKALGRGVLAPAEVQLIGPSATIMRDSEGKLQLGFQAPGADPSDVHADALLRAVLENLQSPNPQSRFGYLDRFYVRDAALTLYDSKTRSIWRAPNSLVALIKTAQGVSLRLDAKVAGGEGAFDLAAEGKLLQNEDHIETNLHLSGLRLSKLARGTHGLEPFEGVDVPLHGDARLTVGLDGEIRAGSFWLFANAGHVVMPGLPSVALDLKAAEAKGVFDAKTDRVTLERLAYDAGSNRGFMTGEAMLQRTDDGRIGGVALNLQADGIALDMPDLFSARGKIDSVKLRGAIDLDNNRVTIENASLRMGETGFVLAGTVDDKPEGLGLALNGSIEQLAVRDFAKLWPIGPARGARDWIVTNMPQGVITRGVLRISAKPGDLAAPTLPDDVLDVNFEFEHVDVNYLRGLTPLTGGRGHARLTGDRFDLALDEGRIGTLKATEGSFAVNNLSVHGAPGAIKIHLSGESAKLLEVLDMHPLGYPSKFAIAPATVGGTMEGDLSVVVPLRKTVQFADVALDADVETQGFSLPAVYRDFDLSGGSIHFTVTNDALSAKGNARLGAYPATLTWHENFKAREKDPSPTKLTLAVTFDEKGRARAALPLDAYLMGPTPLKVALNGAGKTVHSVTVDADLGPAQAAIPQFGWSKPAGVSARLRFTLDPKVAGENLFRDIVLEGPGLDVRGKVALANDGAFQSAVLETLKIGADTDAAFRAARAARKDGGSALDIALTGRAFFAGPLLSRYKDDIEPKSGPAPDGAPSKDSLKLAADVERLTLAHGVVLTAFKGRYEGEAGRLKDLAVEGRFAGDAGALKAGLAAGPDGRRVLEITSDDAGGLLTGVDLTQNIAGGRLAVTADLPPPGAGASGGQSVSGTILMKDIRVMRAPVLAKLLSFGSFGGIRDLLNGEGILFETVDLPFRLKDKTIAVGAGRAYGPSVGLTIEGLVPRSGGDFDMSGTLVPAYTLNTLLGYVPVLGPIFTSREGEGLVGLTYEVHGDAQDPRVIVNPLSALTPGFLRRIFQFGDRKEAGTKEPAEAVPLAR